MTIHQKLPTPARSEAAKPFSDHLAEARVRQSGAGFASPLLTVTDEQLAHADAMIGWRLQVARQPRVANGFRLTAYGLEKVS